MSKRLQTVDKFLILAGLAMIYFLYILDTFLTLNMIMSGRVLTGWAVTDTSLAYNCVQK